MWSRIDGVNTRPRYLPYLLLLLLSLALFVPGQASLPPLDRDESRYTPATAQMFETGNFVDIRFQDQPRHLQPAGIYWLQAASGPPLSAPEDRDVWAYRVPSLIGATFAVLYCSVHRPSATTCSARSRRASNPTARLL